MVEDEIVTREGIRDNVDWGAAGFEFCGEAPDGEIALPLIEEARPDVLITDIKMPFMDGLQLSKIIREHMPWIKIIILSGHDEFNYAQSAVKMGVTDYLLKPISAQDLRKVLQNLTLTLDKEQQQRQQLKSLQAKVEDTMALTRERFILKLVMGGISSADAIEQSQQLGLDIVAHYYMVVFIHIELCQNSPPFDYHEYHRVEQIVSEFAGNNVDVFLTKKAMEELVLLLKSDNLDQLTQEGNFLAGLLKTEVEKRTNCKVTTSNGSPQNRLGDIHHSFAEALVKTRSARSAPIHQINSEPIGLVKIDHTAIENYLKFGSIQDFDAFFSSTIEPVGNIALKTYLIKHYLFVDIILTANQFISDIGGDAGHITSDPQEIESTLREINRIEDIKDELWKVFISAINVRNQQANPERSQVIQQARTYLDTHFADPDLKMTSLADRFNISPSHFSTVFRQELGITFRDYLAKLRINHAKELLATTSHSCADIAYRSGFNDPHYFSFVFKKKTGLTPQEFRAKSQTPEKVE